MSSLRVLLVIVLVVPSLVGIAQEAGEDPCRPTGEPRNLGVTSVAEMLEKLQSNCPAPSPEDYGTGYALVLDALKEDRALSPDIPPSLSDFDPPQELVFAGSATATRETTAAYETLLTRDEAVEQTLIALRSIGWEPYVPWSANGSITIHMRNPMVCRASRVVFVIPQTFNSQQYILLSSYHSETNCDGDWSRGR